MIRLGTLWRIFVRVMAGALAGAAVVLAVGAWIVTSGPVSVGFLTPYFEESLVFEDAGVHVQLGDTVLAWGGWRRNLDLNAVDVRILRTDGSVIASAPKLSVTLSAAAALRGRLAPLRVELLGPELRFQRGVDGRVTLGGLGGGEEQAGPLVQALLEALSRPRSTDSLIEYLEAVQITDGELWLEDQVTGVTWHALDADAVLERRGDGVAGDLDVLLALDGDNLRLAAAAEYSGVTEVLTLATAFTGLNPSRFADTSPALARLESVNMPVSGTVAAVFERDGTITRVDYDLNAADGDLDIPELWRRPQAFDQIAIRGSLVDGLTMLRFDEVFIVTEATSGKAAGFLTFGPEGLGLTLDATWENISVADLNETWPWPLAPKTRAWVIARAQSGIAREGTLSLRVDPGRFDNLPLRPGEVEMSFTYEEGAMWILEGQPPVTGARGEAHLTGAAFDITAETARVGALDISEGAVHISGLDTPSKSAVVEGVATGTAAEFGRLFSLPPLSLTAVPEGLGGNVATRAQLAFPVRKGLKVDDIKFAAAANVRDLSFADFPGGLQLTRGTFAVRADAAGIEAQGTVAVDGLPVAVDVRHALDGRETPTLVTVTGVLDDAGRETFGLGTDRLIRGEMPFRAQARGDGWVAAEVAVDLDLTAVALNPPIHNWDKPAGEPATAHVRVVPRGDGLLEVPAFSIVSQALTAEGQMAVDSAEGRALGAGVANGIAFEVDWQRLAGEDERGSRLILTSVLDDAGRAAIGYPTGAWATGPVAMTAVLLADGLRTRSADVSLDFGPATVQVPLWGKAPGMDGVAELSLAPGASGRYEFRSFAVSSGGLVASGTIQSGADGRPQQLDVARLVLGETTLTGTVAWDLAGAYQVSLAGERLDLRPLLDGLTEMAAGGTLPQIALAAQFDRVILSDSRIFTALQAFGEHQGGTWRQFQAVAALPSGAPVTANIAGAAGAYSIAVTTTDAGELFREFGIFQGAQGGNMDLRGVYNGPPGQKVFDGGVQVDAFRVANAPALAQILSLASLTGLNNVLQGQGITFVGFEAPFKYRNGDVAVGQARAWGPALGITLEGQFSRRTDEVNLAGTVVPAYTINRVLGAIPLLGELLVGEGVFAIAYRVRGEASQPTVTVNPLSALTPGFLRGIIFGFQPEGANPSGEREELAEEPEEEPEPEPPPAPGG